MATLISTRNCFKCREIKRVFPDLDVVYAEDMPAEKLSKKNITQVPVLQTADGLFYVGRMKRDEIQELIDSEKNG